MHRSLIHNSEQLSDDIFDVACFSRHFFCFHFLLTQNRLAAATTSPKKAGVMSLIDSYEEYEAKYVKIGYKDGEKYAYAPDYERSGP